MVIMEGTGMDFKVTKIKILLDFHIFLQNLSYI